MVFSVYFHYEPCGWTIEIDNVIIYWVLSAKSETI